MQRPAKILYHAHMTRIITNIGITRNEHKSEPQELFANYTFIFNRRKPIKTQISQLTIIQPKSPNKFQQSQQKKT